MNHLWQHGFQATGSVETYVPNDLEPAGITHALQLWAGVVDDPWSSIRLLDSGGDPIAEADTVNTVEDGALRASATFSSSDVTDAVASVELYAGATLVASAMLAAPADEALVVTRVDTLTEA